MMPVNPSSFGRKGGPLRTYSGGTENFGIFETVRALMPNRSAAARSLIPSIKTACRTRAYSSTDFIPRPLPTQAKDSNCRSFTPAQPNKSAASVRYYCSGFYTYFLALGVSFIGHHFWTFRSSGALLPTFLRFFGASGCAFLISSLLLVFLIRIVKVSDPIAAFMSAAVIPLITYSASRLWVFRRSRK